MTRRALVFAGLWLATAGVLVVAPACYGRNCEGSVATYGIDGGEGEMVSDTLWESSPQQGEWLPFKRQSGYVFDLRVLGGRTPVAVHPYLSASHNPSQTGSNYVIGAGNIAEIINTQPNRVDVFNDTCSDYYIRVVVEVPPLPPAAPTATTTPAKPSDAGAP